MIRFEQGNLLTANVEALVNPVNCVGVMGRGLALEFKRGFPGNFKLYAEACLKKQVKPGKMFIVPTQCIFNPHYIINFPTKTHWKLKSQLNYIETGLKDLVAQVKALGIKSIAIPPLGCGNGGLEWAEVLPLIKSAFAELEAVDVVIYAPPEIMNSNTGIIVHSASISSHRGEFVKHYPVISTKHRGSIDSFIDFCEATAREDADFTKSNVYINCMMSHLSVDGTVCKLDCKSRNFHNHHS